MSRRARGVNAASLAARWFYLKQIAGEDNRKLYVRAGAAGAERFLLDPQTRDRQTGHYSIDYFQASPMASGRGGSRRAARKIALPARTGTPRPERSLVQASNRAQFGAGFWLRHQAFYKPLAKAGGQRSRTFVLLNKQRDCLHHIADDPGKLWRYSAMDCPPE